MISVHIFWREEKKLVQLEEGKFENSTQNIFHINNLNLKYVKRGALLIILISYDDYISFKLHKVSFQYFCLFEVPLMFWWYIECKSVLKEKFEHPNELVGSNMAAQGMMLTRFWANTQNVDWTCRYLVGRSTTLKIELELKMRSVKYVAYRTKIRFNKVSYGVII